jgi:hypothetical protein
MRDIQARQSKPNGRGNGAGNGHNGGGGGHNGNGDRGSDDDGFDPHVRAALLKMSRMQSDAVLRGVKGMTEAMVEVANEAVERDRVIAGIVSQILHRNTELSDIVVALAQRIARLEGAEFPEPIEKES